jgi:hypothetical protein
VNRADLEAEFAGALEAASVEDPDWREKMASAFLKLAAEYRVPRGSGQDPSEIQRALMGVAGMFTDHHSGTRSPLASVATKSGRPKLDRSGRGNRSWLVMVAGLELIRGEKIGRAAELSFRAAATAINERASENGRDFRRVTTKEVRSAWSNRARLSDREKHLRNSFFQAFRRNPARWDLCWVAVENAAKFRNSKGVIF